MKGKKTLLAVLKGTWMWGLMTWIYVATTILDPITAPAQLSNLSYYVPVPVDLTGVLAFVISFIAFVLWESWR